MCVCPGVWISVQVLTETLFFGATSDCEYRGVQYLCVWLLPPLYFVVARSRIVPWPWNSINCEIRDCSVSPSASRVLSYTTCLTHAPKEDRATNEYKDNNIEMGVGGWVRWWCWVLVEQYTFFLSLSLLVNKIMKNIITHME